MISTSSLQTAIEENRCAISRVHLTPTEVLVSYRSIPELYESSTDVAQCVLLHQLIDASLNLAFTTAFRSEMCREQVRRFWVKVLGRVSSDAKSYERILHRYLYHFWDHVIERSEEPTLLLEESYIPQEKLTWSPESNFCHRLMPRVQRDAPVDILGRDGTTVLLIEIKYGEVDDRALGQILRYFETIRFHCNTADHLCDLRTVVPVIISTSFPPSHWVTLPSSLRELMRLYYYSIDRNDLVLRDGRRGLQAQLRGSRRYNF
jgi:hypothetical protein